LLPGEDTMYMRLTDLDPRPCTGMGRPALWMLGAVVLLASAPAGFKASASFGERANAERALENARRAGLDQVGIESVAVAGRTVHRLRIGPLADVEAADALSARIERLGFGAPRVAIEH